MSPQTLHLIIPQGTTLGVTFRFQHQLVLAANLQPSQIDPPTSIKIRPMPIAIPAGYNLIFMLGNEEVELITASETPAGNKVVNILEYTGDRILPIGAAASTVPKDLSGQVWSGAAKTDYRLEAKALNFTFEVLPLAGLLTMKASAIDTAAIAANCTYEQMPEKGRQQDKNAYPPNIWAKGYYWDAEYEYSGGIFRAFQGRLFVPAEATTG